MIADQHAPELSAPLEAPSQARPWQVVLQRAVLEQHLRLRLVCESRSPRRAQMFRMLLPKE